MSGQFDLTKYEPASNLQFLSFGEPQAAREFARAMPFAERALDEIISGESLRPFSYKAGRAVSVLADRAVDLPPLQIGDSGQPENDKPERADKDLFDPDKPLSHFDTVTADVYRSGRPKTVDGVKEIVEKLWGEYSAENAARTTIIDLRGPVSGKWANVNRQEMEMEEQAASAMGIERHNFPMDSHSVQSPQAIDSVLASIDESLARGQRVLFHCFHGSDRSGLVAAAYQLVHNPALRDLLKKDPEAAYKEGLEDMRRHGAEPEKYPELCQSLKDFCLWKNQQMNKQALRGNKHELALAA